MSDLEKNIEEVRNILKYAKVEKESSRSLDNSKVSKEDIEILRETLELLEASVKLKLVEDLISNIDNKDKYFELIDLSIEACNKGIDEINKTKSSSFLDTEDKRVEKLKAEIDRLMKLKKEIQEERYPEAIQTIFDNVNKERQNLIYKCALGLAYGYQDFQQFFGKGLFITTSGNPSVGRVASSSELKGAQINKEAIDRVFEILSDKELVEELENYFNKLGNIEYIDKEIEKNEKELHILTERIASLERLRETQIDNKFKYAGSKQERETTYLRLRNNLRESEELRDKYDRNFVTRIIHARDLKQSEEMVKQRKEKLSRYSEEMRLLEGLESRFPSAEDTIPSLINNESQKNQIIDSEVEKAQKSKEETNQKLEELRAKRSAAMDDAIKTKAGFSDKAKAIPESEYKGCRDIIILKNSDRRQKYSRMTSIFVAKVISDINGLDYEGIKEFATKPEELEKLSVKYTDLISNHSLETTKRIGNVEDRIKEINEEEVVEGFNPKM